MAYACTLIIGVLSLTLGGCSGGFGGAPSAGALATDQTFTWPYVDAAGAFGHNEVMDPAEDTTLKDSYSISMLYAGLVTFTPSLTVQPDAALSWDVDSTGTIYTFHLRPNMAFSDGKPITAADFAYSLDRAVDPNLCPVGSANTYYSADPNKDACAQPGATYLTHILGANDRLAGKVSTIIGSGDDATKGLDVLDNRTLRIRLDTPVSFFLEALTYPTADVLERSLVENPKYPGGLWVDHLDQGGVSGPFMLKSYGDGKQMTFVPNPYWEKAFNQQLTIKQIVRPVVTDEKVEYDAYNAGKYDFTDVPTNQYAFARGQADFHSVPSLETDYFGLNTRIAPFDNTQIRQAFDLALNKQLLVDRVENGGAIPTNHIVPEGMPGFDPNLLNPIDGTQSLTGNQKAAHDLITQAQSKCPNPTDFFATQNQPDWCPYISKTSPQTITFYAPQENPSSVQIAQLAAQQWSSVLGLNVQVKVITFDRLVGYITTAAAQDPMQIWAIAWIADYPDPQDWLTIQFGTGSPYNAEGYSNPTLDTQMAQADTERNPVKRMQMYNKAEQQVVDDAVWIPYQQGKSYWRARTQVHGFGLNSLGLMVDVNWPSVYITQQ